MEDIGEELENDDKVLEIMGTDQDPTLSGPDSSIKELLKGARDQRDSRVRFSNIDTHVPHPSELNGTPTFKKSKVAKKNSLLSNTFNASIDNLAETSPSNSSDSEETTTEGIVE